MTHAKDYAANSVTDPATETLAVQLYSQEQAAGRETVSWLELPDERREVYRNMARGRTKLSDEKDAT